MVTMNNYVAFSQKCLELSVFSLHFLQIVQLYSNYHMPLGRVSLPTSGLLQASLVALGRVPAGAEACRGRREVLRQRLLRGQRRVRIPGRARRRAAGEDFFGEMVFHTV